VFVLVVGAARIVSKDGGTTRFRLAASHPNELFSLMRETWPDAALQYPTASRDPGIQSRASRIVSSRPALKRANL